MKILSRILFSIVVLLSFQQAQADEPICGYNSSSSSGTWQNYFISPALTESFSLTYYAIVKNNNIDGLFNFSQGPAFAWDDAATTIRFNTNGQIDVMDGDWYRYNVGHGQSYSAGDIFYIEMFVNLDNNTYSVYVTRYPDGWRKHLAVDYQFRSGHQNVIGFDNANLLARPEDGGADMDAVGWEMCFPVLSPWVPDEGNEAPTVNAGPDIGDAEVGTATSLSGSYSDDGLPSGNVTTQWSGFGPGTVTFGNRNNTNTTATFNAPGTYTLTLTADDGDLQGSDTLQVTVSDPGPGDCIDSGTNSDTWTSPMPINHAAYGNRFSIHFSALSSHFGSNDSLVAFSNGAGSTWDDFSALVRFKSDNTIDSNNDNTYEYFNPQNPATYSPGVPANYRIEVDVGTGEYSVFKSQGGPEVTVAKLHSFRSQFVGQDINNFQLTGGQGGMLSVCDLTVGPAGEIPNDPPVIDAGSSFTLSEGQTTNLNGTASDDGLPENPGQMSYSWTSSNPGVTTFGNSSSLTSSVSFSQEGTYVLTLSVSDGDANVSDTVTVTVQSGGGGGEMNDHVISENGHFRWDFNSLHQIGQFADGSWWVKGPVTITQISPGWDWGSLRNGSVIDPEMSQGENGFDSKVDEDHGVGNSPYNSALNVADNLPVTISVSPSQPVKTLVSTKGGPRASGGCYHDGTYLPAIKRMDTLTIVYNEPPPNSFRPPYGKATPEIKNRFVSGNLDFNKLPKLTPRGNVPDRQYLEDVLRYPRLTGENNWKVRLLSAGTCSHGDYKIRYPDSSGSSGGNHYDYGHHNSLEMSMGLLYVLLNKSDDEKRKILYKLIQYGLDMYGMAKGPGGANAFSANGGQTVGRWALIIFAGYMIDDANMMNVTNSGIVFSELQQAIYVNGNDPEYDPVGNGDYSYRNCCTISGWLGQAIALRVLGLQSVANHDAFFDLTAEQEVEYPNSFDFTESNGSLPFYGFQRAMYDYYWNIQHQYP